MPPIVPPQTGTGPQDSSRPAQHPGALPGLVCFVWDVPAGNTTQSGAFSQPPPSQSFQAFPPSCLPIRSAPDQAPGQRGLMLVIRAKTHLVPTQIKCILTH